MKPSHHSPPGRLVRELKQFISIQFCPSLLSLSLARAGLGWAGLGRTSVVIITQLAAWSVKLIEQSLTPVLEDGGDGSMFR